MAWGAPGVAGILAIYAAITISYSLYLKEIAIVDLAAVASGFVLRAISGGVAAHVAISDWFLIVASFGSLFMVAGKRHAEHVDLREGRGAHRATLEEYSLGFLRQRGASTSPRFSHSSSMRSIQNGTHEQPASMNPILRRG